MNRILMEDAENILKQDIDWSKLDGAKVLVTGAGGMLGSYITRTLLLLSEREDRNIDVYALVRNPDKLPDDIKGKVTVIQQSVSEPADTDVKFD